jgi:Cu/Ag efflux protein CusF
MRKMPMKIVKVALAGATAVGIVSAAALAQEASTGMVTKLDRIHRVIAIERTATGTTGASAGGAVEEFKIPDGLSVDELHAGDRISFSVTEAAGSKTITKLEKQKVP